MGSLHLVADQDSQSKSNNMIKFMLFICLMLGGATNVFGHGNMVKPTVWWDKEWIGMLSGMQCSSGYSIEDLPAGPGAGSSCFWFTNDTFIPHSPTLDDSLRTYRDVYVPGFGPVDISARNPWRAPGSAAVFSPCGNAGGNPGGGYSYRLCKVPEEGMSYLTEECFQETQLDFVGDLQWVQYGLDESTRVEFIANRTRVGTYPKGSQWTKDPIPACYPGGGYYELDGVCDELQFPEPAPGLSGFGETIKEPGKALFLFNIVDKVQVPNDLTPGDYVLSFRWDCEQTPQIWSACSSIKIS